jgi:hypothetical protein
MKILSVFILTVFTYGAALSQGVSYTNIPSVEPEPPSPNEVIKGQKVQRGVLKGPKAKNHPDWMYRSSEVMVAEPSTTRRVTGPEAKNLKVWENDTSEEYMPVMKKERRNLKGPRAKNYKPWNN